MKTLNELVDYLEAFKKHINLFNETKIITVELFSGVKPANYYIPKILEYLNHSPYSNEKKEKCLAWFVEIWINNVCIFRKSRMNETGENLQQYENELCKEIVRDIIFCGFNSAWTVAINHLKRQINADS